ncbi:MAG: 3-deoxy-D-manno-octulosonic acid transferase [Prevotella sp.]|nr:3-deoxy-D-manno-octulosonic acid transferase [Prevotella sp.]
MYNIAIYIYLIGVAIGSLFNKKIKKMWRGEREAVDLLKEKVDPTAKYVWFHAASLGEFEQGRPLIEQLRATHPEYKILLTFFSPSGYEVRKNYEGADIVCYLPLDTIRNARRFLRAVHPVMAFFIKYEFWYNYLHILRHRGVPVYSVSSIFRPGQVFFKWYGRNYAKVLHCITHFFVQNEVSLQLLKGIGIDEATVVGDTRFDRVLQIKEQAKELPIVEAFKGINGKGDACKDNLSEDACKDDLSEDACKRVLSEDACKEDLSENACKEDLSEDVCKEDLSENGCKGCKVFVAGSSWQPDEDIFIRFFNDHPDWKLIIAPHVIGEDHLAYILDKLQMKAVRYTQATEQSAAEARCLIIDCFGLLSTIYRYGEIAYVGGGFGVGIHNVPEAAVWGVPVLFGPNNKRFQEAQDLLACKGSFEVTDYDSFNTIISRLISDDKFRHQCGEASANYVKSRSGATDIIMKSVVGK